MQRVKQASSLIRYKHGDLTAASARKARPLFIFRGSVLSKIMISEQRLVSGRLRNLSLSFFDAESSYEAALIYNWLSGEFSPGPSWGIFKATGNSLHTPRGRGWRVWFDLIIITKKRADLLGPDRVQTVWFKYSIAAKSNKRAVASPLLFLDGWLSSVWTFALLMLWS